MADVKCCDCCGSTRNVYGHVLTKSGLVATMYPMTERPTLDLCESCSTSMRFHWGECKKRGAK